MGMMAAYPRPEHEQWDGEEALSIRRAAPDDLDVYLVRPFPNEDVVFWRKPIDNSRVVKQGDPGLAETCWRAFVVTCLIVVVVVGLLMPNAYGLINAMRLQQLEARNTELRLQKRLLEIRASQLLTPERMQQLARDWGYEEITPDRSFHLRGTGGHAVASLERPRR